MAKKVTNNQHHTTTRERTVTPASIEYQSARTKRRAEARKTARAERKARIAAARERGLVRFSF